MLRFVLRKWLCVTDVMTLDEYFTSLGGNYGD